MNRRLRFAAIVLVACFSMLTTAYGQWVQTNGPGGGFVRALAASGPNLFAGTFGAGIFVSTDDGTNWTRTTSGGFAGRDILALAASGPNLFAATRGGGVFLSTDNGVSWAPVNTGLADSTVQTFAVSGTVIFAGTQTNGVFRSLNNGANWTPASAGLTDPVIQALVVSGGGLFAGTFSGGAFRSTDGGTSWTPVDSGLTSPGVLSLAVSDTNLFAGTQGTGVFLSSNNGVSWVNTGLPNVTVQTLAVSGTTLFAGTDVGGVFRLSDLAQGWVNSGLIGPSIQAFAVKGTNIFAGTDVGGVYLSPDTGVSWMAANSGLTATTVIALAAQGRALFAVTSTGHIFRSADGGTSWVKSEPDIPSPHALALAASGANLYAGTDFGGGGLYRSVDGGATWQTTGSTEPAVLSLAASGSIIIAGLPGGVVAHSTDDGASWISSSLPTQAPVRVVALSGSNIFAASGNSVFLSTDTGTSWGGINNGLTGSLVLALALHGQDAFAGTDHGVFLSTDRGAVWVNTGLMNIPVDAFTGSGSNLFAGTHGQGVFLSTDNGRNWTPASTGLRNTDVQALAVQASSLFAGTLNGAAWSRPLADFPSQIPIAHLSLWFRADNGVLSDSLGRIPEWFDLSTSANHAYQPDPLVQPKFVPNALNGQPVIRFFNSSHLQTVSLAVLGPGQFTMIGVVTYGAGQPAFNAPVWNGIDDPVGGYGLGYRKPNGRRVHAGWGSSTAEAAGDSAYGGQTLILASRYDKLAHYFFIDGIRRDSVPFQQSNFANGPFTVGGAAGAGVPFQFPFDGDVAEIIVYDTALGDQQRSAIETYLRNKYAIVPFFSVNSRNIDFGNIPIGSGRPETLLVTNTGPGTMTLTSVLSDDAQFNVGPASANLTSHSSQPVIVTFTPASAGVKNARIVFTHDGSTSPDTVFVSGTGTAPAFSLTPALLTFGNVVVAQGKQDTLTVTNSGTDMLRISSVTSSSPEFSALPAADSIPPAVSHFFFVTFTPVAAGPRSASVFFTHNGLTSPDTVPVNGSGVVPAFSVVPSVLSFGNVVLGESKLDSVSVRNAGSSILNIISDSSDAGEFTVSPPAASIAPGARQRFDIRFSPVSAGAKSGRIFFTHTGPTSPDTVLISGTALPLVLSPIPGPAVAGNSVTIAIPLPPNYPPVLGMLFYREAGRKAFDSVACSRSGDTLKAIIPAGSVTLRGLEYSIRLTAGPFTFLYPPAGSSAAVRVTVNHGAAQGSFQNQVYKMISVPLELTDPAIASVLRDDYGPYDSLVWRIFRWEQGAYAEFNGIAATVTPGNAFWLITRDGKSFTVDNGQSVLSTQPYSLVLKPGWNQIADPFAFPVAWSGIGHAPPLASDTLVKGPYYFDGSPYRYGDSVLIPWEGYFVFNGLSTPETLLVQATAAPAAFPKASYSPDDYQLQLSARIPEFKLNDLNNVIGFRKDARMGMDRYDYPKPPVMADHVDLSIVEGNARFMGDFKPNPVDGQEWNIRLSSSKAYPQVQVTLREAATLPDGFQQYILDCDNFNVIAPAGKAFGVRLGPAGSIRSFKIIIGTKEYAETHSGGIPLVPMIFALDQNYPNPFNPGTKIRYRLANRSRVSLDIFDALGQRVRTLVDQEQLTGEYAVYWDGAGESGIPVAGGMYVCRLRASGLAPNPAGGLSAVTKLLLIR